ncbi:MAG: iron-sulfur cluster assembly scaffold protein, partial [Fimbriimonadaceae bacterium]|nr:iron-sulfur cluster assembly scaffold protein [Fimbriimonadaceae bacterium]
MILSPSAARHAANPQHAGALQNATHSGSGGVPGDGPYITLWLKVESDCIEDVGFACNGCPSSMATGSVMTSVLLGRTLDQARLINANDILLVLQALPEGKEYYADLAV